MTTTRRQSESITENLCKTQPCRLCNMSAVYKQEWTDYLVSMSAGLLSSIFGKTKTHTVKIGTNYFKCDIFRKTTQKCVCVFKCKCSVVRVEEFFDKACMQRVDAALKEAARLEELAYWKEEVIGINFIISNVIFSHHFRNVANNHSLRLRHSRKTRTQR